MSIHIDRLNYEEYYLDYLEGNLSGDVLAAFEAFLEANPDVVIDDEPATLLPTEEHLDPVIKLALKQTPDLSQLSAETLDYFLISRQEGLLTDQQSSQLDHWLEANIQYRNDARLMQLTKLTPAFSDVYTWKNKLKRPAGRIIPLPLWLGSAAAAAGLAFFLLLSDGTPENPAGPVKPLAHNEAPKDHDPIRRDGNGTADTAPSTTETVDPAGAGIHRVTNYQGRASRGVDVESMPNVDQLAMRPLSKIERNSGNLVPLHIEKAAAGNLPTALNELAIVSTPVSKQPDMANPIVPITERLSAALNTDVDFRTAKAAKRTAKGSSEAKGGGFYLKIGKFEISHRSASR